MEHVDSLMKMRKIATHVVTGLELGTRAVLAFERPLEEGENRVKANQELFAQVDIWKLAWFLDHLKI